ncbi:MAG: hypothetical protein K2Q03_04975 [Sphingobacteriaceae bacterium]|nr:hypothetical protein [Sphingobacteriaceae bacterium]
MKKNHLTRKLNKLARIEKVLNIYKKYKEYDTPNTVIFKKHIEQQFNISFSEFNTYLGINPAKEREKILTKNK